MNYSALIFDMDGTLTNSELIWQKSEANFLKQFSPNFTDKDQVEIVGQNTSGIYKFMCKKFPNEMTSVSKNNFLAEYEKFGLEKIYDKTDLIPGVLDLLKKYDKKIPIALASSAQKSWIDKTLDMHNIRRFFQVIVCGQNLKNAKPAPDIFLETAKQLNVKPKRCLVFEDAKNGILAAKAAGMTVYAISNGFNDTQDLSKADLIFSDFNKLLL